MMLHRSRIYRIRPLPSEVFADGGAATVYGSSVVHMPKPNQTL